MDTGRKAEIVTWIVNNNEQVDTTNFNSNRLKRSIAFCGLCEFFPTHTSENKED